MLIIGHRRSGRGRRASEDGSIHSSTRHPPEASSNMTLRQVVNSFPRGRRRRRGHLQHWTAINLPSSLWFYFLLYVAIVFPPCTCAASLSITNSNVLGTGASSVLSDFVQEGVTAYNAVYNGHQRSLSSTVALSSNRGASASYYEQSSETKLAAQLFNGSTDFFVSVNPTLAAEASQQQQQSTGVRAYPFAITTLALVHSLSLPSGATLSLPPSVIADIFLGDIQDWNASVISSANPSLSSVAALPLAKINVIVCSDGCGTNYLFTSSLSALNSKVQNRLGTSANPRWCEDGNNGTTALQSGVSGSLSCVKSSGLNVTYLVASQHSDVLRLLKRTPNAIAYIDYSANTVDSSRLVGIQGANGNIFFPQSIISSPPSLCNGFPSFDFLSSSSSVTVFNHTAWCIITGNSTASLDAVASWPFVGYSYVFYAAKLQRKTCRARQQLLFFLRWLMSSFTHQQQENPRLNSFLPLPHSATEQFVQDIESRLVCDLTCRNTCSCDGNAACIQVFTMPDYTLKVVGSSVVAGVMNSSLEVYRELSDDFIQNSFTSLDSDGLPGPKDVLGATSSNYLYVLPSYLNQRYRLQDVQSFDQQFVSFPFVTMQVFAVFNLAGLLPADKSLVLSASIVADILLGKITMWNDVQIASINPGIALPSVTMRVLVHAQQKSVLAALSYFLSTASTDFSRQVGISESPNFGQFLGSRMSHFEAGDISSVANQIFEVSGALTFGGADLVSKVDSNMVASIQLDSTCSASADGPKIERAGMYFRSYNVDPLLRGLSTTYNSPTSTPALSPTCDPFPSVAFDLVMRRTWQQDVPSFSSACELPTNVASYLLWLYGEGMASAYGVSSQLDGQDSSSSLSISSTVGMLGAFLPAINDTLRSEMEALLLVIECNKTSVLDPKPQCTLNDVEFTSSTCSSKSKMNVTFGWKATSLQSCRGGISLPSPLSDVPCDYLSSPQPMGALLISLCVIGSLMCMTVSGWTVRHSRAKVIALSQRGFLYLSLMGCCIMSLSSILFLGRANESICLVRKWMVNLTISIIFAPLIMKLRRVLLLSSSKMKKVIISNGRVLAQTMGLCVVDVIILITLSIVDPPVPVYFNSMSNTSDAGAAYSLICKSDSGPLEKLLLVWKCLIFGAGLYYGFTARHIDGHMSDGKYLFAAVICALSAYATLWSLSRYGNLSPASLALTYGVVAITMSLMTTSLMTIPKIYKYYTDPDAALRFITPEEARKVAQQTAASAAGRYQSAAQQASSSPQGNANRKSSIEDISLGNGNDKAPPLPVKKKLVAEQMTQKRGSTLAKRHAIVPGTVRGFDQAEMRKLTLKDSVMLAVVSSRKISSSMVIPHQHEAAGGSAGDQPLSSHSQIAHSTNLNPYGTADTGSSGDSPAAGHSRGSTSGLSAVGDVYLRGNTFSSGSSQHKSLYRMESDFEGADATTNKILSPQDTGSQLPALVLGLPSSAHSSSARNISHPPSPPGASLDGE